MTSNLELIYIVIVFAICITAVIRYFESSWFTPASLFALIWAFIIPFSVLTAPDYKFSYQALIFIVACVFVFFTGSLAASSLIKPNYTTKQFTLSSYGQRLIVVYILLSIGAGCTAYFLLLYFAGLNIENYFSINSLLAAADGYTAQRYNGERLPGVLMFLLMISYSGCLVGGFAFSISNSIRKKILSIIVLIPVLCFAVIYTARSVFLYAMVQFLSAGLLTAVLRHGLNLRLFNLKNVFLFALSAFLIIGFFFFGQVARAGELNLSQDMYINIAKHLKVWFSGNVSGFSIWFSQPDFDKHQHMWGAQTFAGLAEWMGLNYREVGIYKTSFDVNGCQDFSNIYTYFRFLIDDFGIAFSMVILFVTGFFSKALFVNVVKQKISSLAVLSGIVSLILFSFIASVMAYNTVFFSWILFVFFIYYIEKQHG